MIDGIQSFSWIHRGMALRKELKDRGKVAT